MSIQAASRPVKHTPPAIENRQVHVDGNFGGLGLHPQQSEDDPLKERLKFFEMRVVIHHEDGHDLATAHPRLWPALLARCRPLRQQPSLPAWIKSLAKIIELTKIF